MRLLPQYGGKNDESTLVLWRTVSDHRGADLCGCRGCHVRMAPQEDVHGVRLQAGLLGR